MFILVDFNKHTFIHIGLVVCSFFIIVTICKLYILKSQFTWKKRFKKYLKSQINSMRIAKAFSPNCRGLSPLLFGLLLDM